jgi:hemoglobin
MTSCRRETPHGRFWQQFSWIMDNGPMRMWGDTPVSRPSMFEFAGGWPAFLALAAAHHQRCLDDPVLNHPFSHPGHPQHVERLAGYWAEVFGGPSRYSAVSAGHSAMLRIHAGMDAESDLGHRFVECFVQAADDVPLPDDPEFRRELRNYMEWAVKEVDRFNPGGSVVPTGLAMPHWSWGGLVEPDLSGP